jgi:hypothetical protein
MYNNPDAHRPEQFDRWGSRLLTAGERGMSIKAQPSGGMTMPKHHFLATKFSKVYP